MTRSIKDMLACARYMDQLRVAGIDSVEDREALRRISMTLHRWFELECGNGNDHGSWSIVRGCKNGKQFVHDDDGTSFMEHHHYLHGRGKDYVTYSRIPDREMGARKRLAKIMARHPELLAYVQTDPRGCALYILRKTDVGDSEVSCCYTRGIAVYQ
jgi:hypothetical protein